jgi:hypothetical protein
MWLIAVAILSIVLAAIVAPMGDDNPDRKPML